MSTTETHSQNTQPQSGTSNWDHYGEHRGRVLHREPLAKNVSLYVVEKPEGFDFRPGQAVELAIDEVRYREKARPFTITSLPNNPRLEFIIKSYPTQQFPSHEGVTEHLGRDIEVNDRVIFSDPWGTIEYKGPGVFIAGGAGITPFIAILRKLEQGGQLDGNRLFFSNKSREDVFLQGELFRMMGRAVVCTLTQENHHDYEHGRIDRAWLESRVDDFSQPFYVCGPPSMVDDLKGTLEELGAEVDSIVFEE
ncbi:FAD-binding oxidoreductase [Rhodopirellula sp. JC639]|uniref:FAD-binding oxidoreductase n=1 Tax=Stieleria mannarensis TaxID=2755585 RepID=UPI0016034AFA|nr:FAD-binding oxidoreductase [Rhodopirellula sp. JC639]